MTYRLNETVTNIMGLTLSGKVGELIEEWEHYFYYAEGQQLTQVSMCKEDAELFMNLMQIKFAGLIRHYQEADPKKVPEYSTYIGVPIVIDNLASGNFVLWYVERKK